MIEVEKKFLLEPGDEQPLLRGAEFIGEKAFTDTYYDTADYALTTHDLWLRLRDDRFELKVPMQGAEKFNQYEELETEDAIRAHLSIQAHGRFVEDLSSHGYIPFATYRTVRRTYRKGPFVIDLDEADFGYSVVEIERMVAGESDIPQATTDILAFAETYGLEIAHVRGKLIEYIHRTNPSHYHALLVSGVVSEEAT